MKQFFCLRKNAYFIFLLQFLVCLQRQVIKMKFARENNLNNNAVEGDPRIIFRRLDVKRNDGNIL